MDTPIITIGREYGAGGHTVARIIAQSAWAFPPMTGDHQAHPPRRAA